MRINPTALQQKYYQFLQWQFLAKLKLFLALLLQSKQSNFFQLWSEQQYLNIYCETLQSSKEKQLQTLCKRTQKELVNEH